MGIALSGYPAPRLADTWEIPYLVGRKTRGPLSGLLHRARVAYHHATYTGRHSARWAATHG